ncbi:hypothetical protein M413DRAFT_22979 [Hebeloma cylindrosporum]|uniref:Uncharacterized protein n=1 Tax=Hebeloma cylindrosporum TaxID=76867 RepID=A0A0C3CXD4_HEBCY|nr:hypothetical protein M413DRAFT_22979 [Hebeloma cylindrosporum h7]
MDFHMEELANGTPTPFMDDSTYINPADLFIHGQDPTNETLGDSLFSYDKYLNQPMGENMLSPEENTSSEDEMKLDETILDPGLHHNSIAANVSALRDVQCDYYAGKTSTKISSAEPKSVGTIGHASEVCSLFTAYRLMDIMYSLECSNISLTAPQHKRLPGNFGPFKGTKYFADWMLAAVGFQKGIDSRMSMANAQPAFETHSSCQLYVLYNLHSIVKNNKPLFNLQLAATHIAFMLDHDSSGNVFNPDYIAAEWCMKLECKCVPDLPSSMTELEASNSVSIHARNAQNLDPANALASDDLALDLMQVENGDPTNNPLLPNILVPPNSALSNMVYFTMDGFWDVIMKDRPTDAAKAADWDKIDKKAYSFLYFLIDPVHQSLIIELNSGSAAWQALKADKDEIENFLLLCLDFSFKAVRLSLITHSTSPSLTEIISAIKQFEINQHVSNGSSWKPHPGHFNGNIPGSETSVFGPVSLKDPHFDWGNTCNTPGACFHCSITGHVTAKCVHDMPAQIKFGIINAKPNQIKSANLVEQEDDGDYTFLSQVNNLTLLSIPEDSGSAPAAVQEIPKTICPVCVRATAGRTIRDNRNRHKLAGDPKFSIL